MEALNQSLWPSEYKLKHVDMVPKYKGGVIIHTDLHPIAGGYLILTLAPNAFSPKFDKLTRPANGDTVVDLSTMSIVLFWDKSCWLQNMICD